MRRTRRSCTARFLSLALAVAFVTEARAQDPVPFDADLAIEVHTLEILDGHLHLDGERLPDEAIPAGLDLEGLTLQVQYSGPVAPLLTLGGVAYVLKDRRLVRFEGRMEASAPASSDAVQVYGLGQPAALRSASPAPPRAAPEAAGRAASESAYLMHLSEEDRQLYNLLQRERSMEADALRLAQRIRRTPASEQRSALVDDLRALLSDAFALKQVVRRAEVERAEAQLDAVRERLVQRAARHDAIVEERLRSLVGDL